MTGKRIPYGISNYQTIAREGYLYVDKTRFIRVLEENREPFVFFLRPRRFEKSLFVSLLGNYYDRLQKDHFDELKEATKTIVGRIFAIGVSPITLDILTREMNNGSSPEWAAMKKVKRWVLVFAGDRCVYNHEVTP